MQRESHGTMKLHCLTTSHSELPRVAFTCSCTTNVLRAQRTEGVVKNKATKTLPTHGFAISLLVCEGKRNHFVILYESRFQKQGMLTSCPLW